MAWDRRIVLLLILCSVVAAGVEARFAASTGFSGRNVDCTACHAPAPGVPVADVTLDGAPDTWRPGQTYDLAIQVSGGPEPMPAPQPQGGFELEAAAGRLGPGDGMEGLLRFPKDTTATYLPEGTLRRDWQVTWTAPDGTQAPEPVDLWLAAVAANGNHVILTNTSDGGEQGDAVATLHLQVPAAQDVIDAWQALPLAVPVVERIEEAGDVYRIIGHHQDGNATHIAYRYGDSAWRSVETPADTPWRITVDRYEDVAVRSEGTGRISPDVAAAPPAKDTPWPAAFLAPIIAAWAARRIR